MKRIMKCYGAGGWRSRSLRREDKMHIWHFGQREYMREPAQPEEKIMKSPSDPRTKKEEILLQRMPVKVVEQE